jgi:hypothetical protein
MTNSAAGTGFYYWFYNWSVSGLGCISPKIPVVLTSTIAPSVSIASSSAAICVGSPVGLSASGATNYTWSTGATTASISATPTANTTYSVLGTDGTCTNSAITTITVNALPIVSLTSPQNTICVGGPTIGLTGTPAGGVYTGSFVTGNVFAPGASSGTFTQTYAYTNTITTCSNTASNTIVISNCTGVNSIITSSNGLSVYPNPNTGLFTIELNNGSVKTIEVMDVTGRIVLANTTSNDKVDVNINTLANGIYYVRIQLNNSIEVVKIVKQ